MLDPSKQIAFNKLIVTNTEKQSMKDPKLRNSLLLQLVENAQDGVVVSEKEGDDTILIYVNPAFEKLTGYKADEMFISRLPFSSG